jgi:AraC family transcriptional regulator of arabinose operon
MKTNELFYVENSTSTWLDYHIVQKDYYSVASIVLDGCGYTSNSKFLRYDFSNIKNNVLCVVTNGDGIYHYQGEKYRLKKGDTFLVSPKKNLEFSAAGEEPFGFCWIVYHGYRSEEYTGKMGLNDNSVIHVDNSQDICNYVIQILEHRSMNLVNELIRMDYVLKIIIELLHSDHNDVDSVVENPENQYVKSSIHFMMSHYYEDISVQIIADYLGISRGYFNQVFTKHSGISPSKFLNNVRMEEAAHLLKTTDETVDAVAFDCGFTSVFSFTKAFHKKYGVPPAQYRRSIKE